MITLEIAIQRLLCDNVIRQSFVYSDGKSKYWRLTHPVHVQLSNKVRVTIPEGYTYDMATVPKWLWSFVRPYNQALLAFLIHDYLYTHQAYGFSRSFVDAEYLRWAEKINPCGWFDNYFRYIFIRAFGWLWWNDYV